MAIMTAIADVGQGCWKGVGETPGAASMDVSDISPENGNKKAPDQRAGG